MLASLFTYMRKLSTRAMSETSELWPCLRAGESTSESACKDERLHVESMEHLRFLERAMGIEPTSEAWEASILPLYDARSSL